MGDTVLLNEYETVKSTSTTTSSGKSWESSRNSMRGLGVWGGMGGWPAGPM